MFQWFLPIFQHFPPGKPQKNYPKPGQKIAFFGHPQEVLQTIGASCLGLPDADGQKLILSWIVCGSEEII